jgi:putative ABC transport system ATP-binding protein
MDLLTEINGSGITVLVVTHDPEVARRTQRTIRLRDGRVVDSSLSGASNPHLPVEA